jgi:S1-C subfamily serine protease
MNGVHYRGAVSPGDSPCRAWRRRCGCHRSFELVSQGYSEPGKSRIDRAAGLPEEGSGLRLFLMPFRMSMMGLFLLAFLSSAQGEVSLSQIFETSASSVATVFAFDGQGKPCSSGSGFLISKEGDMVTSHHVLSGCVKAVARTLGGVEGPIIEITRDDPKKDLLVARTSLKDRRPLPLGYSEGISIGEDVVVIGIPPERGVILSSGIVKAVNEVEGMRLLQITAPVLPGCSGGPVFNRHGTVVGVAVAFVELRENRGFVMPVDYIQDLPAVRLMPPDLPAATGRLKVAVAGDRVVEVLMMREEAEEKKVPVLHPPPSSPGTVYLNDGRRLLCDRAWKEGKTVFLVLHGKRFAIGYDEARIHMQRSFVSPP